MRVSNTAIGVFLIIFSAVVLWHVQSFPSLDNGYPGPALFPSVLAVLFIFCGIGLIIQGIRQREKLLKFDTGTLTLSGLLNILFVLGTIVCYIFLAQSVGFLIFSRYFSSPRQLTGRDENSNGIGDSHRNARR